MDRAAAFPTEAASPDHHDFVLNDGNVTVIGGPVVDEDPQPEADQDVVRGDGSDSGVELTSQDRTEPENTPLDTPTQLDYDGNSEGGSESSASVFSSHHRASPGPTAPAPAPRRKPAAAAPATPTARERSASGRGASCSRVSRASSGSAADRQRTGLSTPRRPSNLMSSSMTTSLTGNLCSGSASRGPPTTPRTPRGAAAAAACRDDGRWPSTVQRAASVSRGRTAASSSGRSSVTASTPSPTVESKSDKFATLPRRRRRRSVESPGHASPAPQAPQAPQAAARKLRITLYHETAAQTALTSQDVEAALEGKACSFRPLDAVDLADQEVQVDLDKEEAHSQMLDRRLKSILDVLGLEQLNSQRAQSPLKHIDHSAWVKTLDMIERKACIIRQRDLEQRNEIGRLNYELHRMGKQLKETESEHAELQEFLQEEKVVLSESLKEAEVEIREQKALTECLQKELERQREECQHLVRMSEQRRQEILTLEARAAGQDQRSREALLHQGAAVSGAAVALCALTSRLDSLALKLEGTPLEEAFLALTAEAEAVTTHTKEACRPLSNNFDNAYQTLDNVTEPVLEDEGCHRDSVHSDTFETTRLVNSESIQNLSTAILNRRLQEEANNSYSSKSEDAPVHLVDQVLDVDTSITRLLRAIQQTMNSCNLFQEKITSINQCDAEIRQISDVEQSFNQMGKPQKYTSLLNSSSNELHNNPVSNGIIELAFAPGRVSGAS